MGMKSKLQNQDRIFQDQTRNVIFSNDRNLVGAINGYHSVMIEAGSRIAAAAIKADIVDRIEWFRAPIIIGGGGIPVLADIGLDSLSDAPKFTRVAVTPRGADLQESYERIL
ncbi:MAG: dihydrofolate reductase family protein, partial [Maricaulis sp.]|nr:dihydrofolate reductase family protein [Maricaulis sp.]